MILSYVKTLWGRKLVLSNLNIIFNHLTLANAVHCAHGLNHCKPTASLNMSSKHLNIIGYFILATYSQLDHWLLDIISIFLL